MIFVNVYFLFVNKITLELSDRLKFFFLPFINIANTGLSQGLPQILVLKNESKQKKGRETQTQGGGGLGDWAEKPRRNTNVTQNCALSNL